MSNPTSASPANRAAPALALIGVLLTIPAVYAGLRLWDVATSGPAVNPATAPVSIHIAMFWRLTVAAYAAGMVAPVVYLAACQAVGRTVEVLSALALAVAVLAVVQGALFP